MGAHLSSRKMFLNKRLLVQVIVLLLLPMHDFKFKSLNTETLQIFTENWNEFRCHACGFRTGNVMIHVTDNYILANDLTVRNSSYPIIASILIFMFNIYAHFPHDFQQRLPANWPLFLQKSKSFFPEIYIRIDLYTSKSSNILCNWVQSIWSESICRK